jgi:hypothetical protein
MREKGIMIQRKQLYKQVWAKPLSKLAKDYGISDVGLKKICKKLNVPTPPRGYWARVYGGQKLNRVALPRLKYGQDDTYYLDPRNEPTPVPEIEDDTRQLIDKMTRNKGIPIPKRLVRPHPLVENTLSKMQKSTPDKYTIIRAYCNSCLDIRVSKNSVKRACRIANALIKTLEKHGFEILIKDRETKIIVPGIDDEVRIYFKEKVKQVDHKMTAKELADEKRRGWCYAPKYDYEPTGILGLFIDEYSGRGLKKQWRDTKKNKIEHRLVDFLIGIIRIADCSRRERLEREEERRRWEEEQRRRAELERLRQIELEKRAVLEQQAQRWEQSRQIRGFIEAVRAKAKQADQMYFKRSQLNDWVKWAGEHAERLDPLSTGLPFAIEQE